MGMYMYTVLPSHITTHNFSLSKSSELNHITVCVPTNTQSGTFMIVSSKTALNSFPHLSLLLSLSSYHFLHCPKSYCKLVSSTLAILLYTCIHVQMLKHLIHVNTVSNTNTIPAVQRHYRQTPSLQIIDWVFWASLGEEKKHAETLTMINIICTCYIQSKDKHANYCKGNCLLPVCVCVCIHTNFIHVL